MEEKASCITINCACCGNGSGGGGNIPEIGENGNWFINGEDTGISSRGDSAYQLAVKNGFIGTEVEWLESLKGESDPSTTMDSAVYSVEETICGTWIDGKKIYRKVITGTTTKDDGEDYIFAKVNSLKIEKMIRLYGNATSSNPAIGQIAIPTSYASSSGTIATAINMWYMPMDETIRYHLVTEKGTYSLSPVNLVLEYTKK